MTDKVLCLGQLHKHRDFRDAISSVPEFLSVPEIRSDFLKELAWAYLFGFAVSASYIVRLVRERKNKK